MTGVLYCTAVTIAYLGIRGVDVSQQFVCVPVILETPANNTSNGSVLVDCGPYLEFELELDSTGTDNKQ